MAKLELFGSYVALITPFTDADEVDYACIEELVEWHVKEGTAGIVPCGTTGESPTLSEEEHFKVIETVVKKAAGRIHVIGGAGGNCTKKVVAATEKCKALGCTAVLSVIPYYNKPTQGGLIAHFTVHVQRVSLQSNTAREDVWTGCKFEYEQRLIRGKFIY